MSSDHSSESLSDSDDDTSNRIKHLQKKIAKLEKKKRKSKKAKKRRKRASTCSLPESNDGVAPTSSTEEEKPSASREAWMMTGDVGNLFPCVSITEVKAERKKEREERLYETDKEFRSKVEAKKLLENPGSHSRELNPYWKDGGSGLPSEDPSSSKKVAGIGDSGSSWLRRAFRRAQEMAEEQGKSVEDVVAERWGSVEKLEEMMSKAEGRPVHLNLERRGGDHSRSSRDDEEDRSSRYKRPKDYDDGKDRRRHHDDSNRTSSKSWRKSRPEDRPLSPKEATPSTTSEQRSSTPPPSTSNEQKEKPETEDDLMLTPAEMNALGAKILKAELMGKKDLAAKLQAKLDKAREATRGKRIVVEPQAEEKKRPERLTAEMHKYKFDDRYSLNAMFAAEKSTTDASDGDRALFNKMSARAAKMAAMGMEERVQPDEWDESSVGVEKVVGSKSFKKEAQSALKSEEAERKRSQALDVVRERQLDTCLRCFDSPKMIKHLMIAMGSFTYLSVPGYESLADGHCLISPLAHVPSSLDADENVWAEVQNFGRSVTRMFRDRGEDCVFFEYFGGTKSRAGFPHLTLNCVPLPVELGDQAPIYFKKALLECETEWAQNKKVVDIPRGRDVRSVIPKGLPYFYVSFAWDDLGFAHVIEDEEAFPQNFAQEILGGMLQLDPRLWRKPMWENFDVHCEKVEAFNKGFAPYDWTSASS